MSLAFMDINYLAVLVCAIFNMILGSIWYNPSFPLGRAWMKLSGFKSSSMDKPKGMGTRYFIALVGAYIMYMIFALIIQWVNPAGIADAIQLSFFVWIAFIGVSMLGIVLWENKSVKLYLINSIYYLIAMIVGSIILVVWI